MAEDWLSRGRLSKLALKVGFQDWLSDSCLSRGWFPSDWISATGSRIHGWLSSGRFTSDWLSAAGY